MREKLIHELKEERRLRLDSEERLREAQAESESGRTQMVSLQQHFSRMEETVRSLLQNQGILDQTAIDTVDIMKAYKEKLSEEVEKQRGSLEEAQKRRGSLEEVQERRASLEEVQERRGSPDEGGLSGKREPPEDARGAEEEPDRSRLLLERLRALEEENSALASEKESQREQYERCLDEVANQVVQALLTQKDLREECLKLRTRVFDLEQQNRSLSVMFQQRVRPASDLLLQKLHSRIMHLSAADLLLEPERSKNFLLSRNTDAPPHDATPFGRAGLPASRCASQLSVAAAAWAWPLPRCSRSSSEVSLSSACSEFSSGSYTWNDGRSLGKVSSLTWEKRLSLGSSAPAGVCVPPEEPPLARGKESHILEGLRKLQRRRPRASSSPRVSASGYKDCMNSNEGIYSLGVKGGIKGASKPHVGRAAAAAASTASARKFSYDSDDADDESPRSADCGGDRVPVREGWMYCKKLSHSVSDSLCSWEGLQDAETAAGDGDAKQAPPCDYTERPEKLMSFISRFLSGGRASAVLDPALLHAEFDPDFPLRLSDTEPEDLPSEADDLGPTPGRTSDPPQTQKEPERLSRGVSTPLSATPCSRREQGRTQSADGRPRPFSLIKEHKGAKSQSEESLMAIFDADGEPIELSAQQSHAVSGSQPNFPGCLEAVSQEGLVKQKGFGPRNFTAPESPEKWLECQGKAGRSVVGGEGGGAERLASHPALPMKLIKPTVNRANKVHSVPPMTDASGPKAGSSKIPGRGKGPLLKGSKGPNAEPTSGPPAQEKSPTSPPVKMSRFIKTPCTQTTKVSSASKLPGKSDWVKGPALGHVPAPGPTPSSPHPPRRLLDLDYAEQPTRDRHYETSKTPLRSPSPPPPPGRTTSLLIRPNYDGSPQALKTGAQPPAPTTVRGPPPSYHPPPVPNMQHTLPYKGHDSVDLDAGYGTAIAPQKLVDKTGQFPGLNPLPKGTLTRTPKHYLPASGYAPDHPENAAKNSKNVPPYPHGALKNSSLHSTFTSKKSSANENSPPQPCKTSSSLPASLQSPPPEAQGGPLHPPPPTAAPGGPATLAPPAGQAEKVVKTRIPMGFKAFVKTGASHKRSVSAPGKQEKEHINSASRETAPPDESPSPPASPPPAYSIDPPAAEAKGEGRPGGTATAEGAEPCVKTDGRQFLRSISVSAKPHLKPALGMNGAKARSQSFSTNYMEKPSINGADGPGKIRTQIITKSGERGSSLTRQSSLAEVLPAKPSAAPAESPVHCPGNRLSLYGGLTASNSHHVLPEKTPKSGGAKGGGKGESTTTTPPQKEARSLPLSDRLGLRNARRPAKVASHPQLEPPPSPAYSPEAPVPGHADPNRPGRGPPPRVSLVTPEEAGRQAVPAACCTIEEKVMMGIEENVQKVQGQEKSQASEAKQKTGPSLANWFGLRKSKLPALNGKKADAPKGRELKIGSVLGGKQMKSDKKEKKKTESPSKESQDPSATCVNNKLDSIMDHCNLQMGQIANQIQCSTIYIGKDQLVKDLLSRRGVLKADSLTAAPPDDAASPKHRGEPRADGEAEAGRDKAAIMVTQKMSVGGDVEEDVIPEATCQDHMIDSGCQMRTLDSGIGTFPLHDPVTRGNGRHLPKSESSPDRVAAVAPDEHDEDPPAPSSPAPPHVKVPFPPESRPHALDVHGPSPSDPAVTSGLIQEVQSRLPKPSTSDAIRTRRLSQMELRADRGATVPTHVQDKPEKKRGAKELNSPSERALRVCTYSGSSSDTETESEGNTLGSPRKTPPAPPNANAVAQNEEAAWRSGAVKSLSIMDYCPHGLLVHLEKDARRGVAQFGLLLKEAGSEVKAGERLIKGNQLVKTSVGAELRPISLDVSLESLNKLNLAGGAGLFPGAGAGRVAALRSGGADEPPSSSSSSGLAAKAGADPAGGSLSDSLYDSFSSCTSQGSNDV